jgi:hypothetical protein
MCLFRPYVPPSILVVSKYADVVKTHGLVKKVNCVEPTEQARRLVNGAGTGHLYHLLPHPLIKVTSWTSGWDPLQARGSHDPSLKHGASNLIMAYDRHLVRRERRGGGSNWWGVQLEPFTCSLVFILRLCCFTT